MYYYKAPHALMILKEQRDEYRGERFLLQGTDPEKSARRIRELKYLIGDLDFAIEALEEHTE